MSNLAILSTHASEYLARAIAADLGISLGTVHRHEFRGGEQYYRIDVGEPTDLVRKNVAVVGSTHSDAATLELIRVGSALAAGHGTRRRIFVIPFFGYSTMERAAKPGEVVTAKTQARMLSGIPNSGMGNAFLMLDLHTPGLVHYFEGDCLRMELRADDLLREAIAELGLPTNFMFGSADLGRPVVVQRLAAHFKTDIALIAKRRDGEHTQVDHVIGDVRGRTVVIYDDMIRSGGSLVQAAQAYLTEGATAIYAVASHLALTDDAAVDTLFRSPIKRFLTTDSHPASQWDAIRQSGGRVIVKPTTQIWSRTIKQIVGA